MTDANAITAPNERFRSKRKIQTTKRSALAASAPEVHVSKTLAAPHRLVAALIEADRERAEHPRADDGLSATFFNGEGLDMSLAFKAAYEAAEAFSRLYAHRCPGAGFLKTILLRRIGSSAKAGLETARHLLGRIDPALVPEDEVGDEKTPTDVALADPQEIQFLRDVERNLASVVTGADADPKVQVVLHYLRERNWLEENGAIIFSQYRTTAEWVLEALCAVFPDEPVALYAGGAASFVQRGDDRRTAAAQAGKIATAGRFNPPPEAD